MNNLEKTQEMIPAVLTDDEKSLCRVTKSGSGRDPVSVVSRVRQKCPGRRVISRCPTAVVRAAAARRGRRTSGCG